MRTSDEVLGLPAGTIRILNFALFVAAIDSAVIAACFRYWSSAGIFAACALLTALTLWGAAPTARFLSWAVTERLRKAALALAKRSPRVATSWPLRSIALTVINLADRVEDYGWPEAAGDDPAPEADIRLINAFEELAQAARAAGEPVTERAARDFNLLWSLGAEGIAARALAEHASAIREFTWESVGDPRPKVAP